MRDTTGYTSQDEKGRWFYRYTFSDNNGKRRNVRRLATSENNAKSELRKALNKQDQQGERAIEGDRLRFVKLIEIYKQKKVFAAKYDVNKTKVGGFRSLAHVEMLIKTLSSYFQNRLVKSITHSDIEHYKFNRLNILKSNDEQRTIASVNRELEQLRAIMNFAEREGWLVKSPFKLGAPLISKADENKRDRTLSYGEENRLLAACDISTYTYVKAGKEYTIPDKQEAYIKRQLLKTIIIMAVDTGMRRGEIFKLVWHDVDFVSDKIIIKAMNSKTAEKRTVGITPRLKLQLEKLWSQSKQLNDSVFGYDKPESTIKKVWATACRNAELSNLKFHDLRHTAITRLISSGTPSSEVMKISGHRQITTFLRYLNPDSDSVKLAAMRLEAHNTQASAK